MVTAEEREEDRKEVPARDDVDGPAGMVDNERDEEDNRALFPDDAPPAQVMQGKSEV